MIGATNHRNIYKLLLAGFLFLTLTIGAFQMSESAQAVEKRRCGQLVNNNDTLDADCKCPRNQCRLSKLATPSYGGNSENGQGTDRVLLAAEDYLCVGAGEVLTDALPSASDYKAKATLDGQDTDGDGDSGVDSSGKVYDTFYTDEFSRLPNNQNIPQGAVCTIAGGYDPDQSGAQAYWFNPNYFNPEKRAGGPVIDRSCEMRPLFVQRDLFGNPVTGVSTFFGCLPGSVNGIVAFVLRLLIGLTGFVTFLIILINLLKIVGNSSNPDVVAESQKKLTSAVVTFIVLIMSVTILNIVGVEVLDITSLGGGVLSIFLGR
jgi:hypothetical protein